MSPLDEFRNDRTGKRFAKLLDDEPAFAAALADGGALLDQPHVRQRLQDAEALHGRPALWGAEAALEALPAVQRLRESHPELRDSFNKAVGVLVRMAMEDLGWQVRKGATGSMGPSSRFRTAQRYERVGSGGAIGEEEAPVIEAHLDPDYVARVKAGLDRIAEMGSEEEQRETFEYLMRALAQTRAEEGRPF